ncbi:hypothetical protein [Agromyces sp. SYSU T0242]|uniref:hypothetical protein n=1 Tax=Agromyces litoreus TaxID=3158561 RepID=UPI0033910ADF
MRHRLRGRRGVPGEATGRPLGGAALCAAAIVVLAGCAPATGSPASPSPTPAETTAAPSPTATPDAEAVPLITSAEWNEPSLEVLVSGLVPGTVDETEPCVLVGTSQGAEVERTRSGQAGPSSLDCGRFELSSDELGPGTWTFTLSYAGASSEPVDVEVP